MHHTLTIRTRFTFHDRVRFDSKAQMCSGVGKVIGITVEAEGEIYYLISFDRDGETHFQPGIYESEIALLEAGETGG